MFVSTLIQTIIAVPGRALLFARVHPLLATVIVAAVAGVGYWSYSAYTSTDGETQYVLAAVERGDITLAVSGSGQVSAENQFNVLPKASGDIISVNVKNGDTVKAGALIAQIDARDAQKAVRDAEVNLEAAKLTLQKLTQPATSLSVTQAENALTDADNALAKAYDDGFNEVSDTFLMLPSVMSGLEDVLYDDDVTGYQDNVQAYADMIDDIEPTVVSFRDDAIQDYKDARTAYDTALLHYKAASRFSNKGTIEQLILETYEMTKAVAEASKSTSDLLNFVNDSLVLRDRTIPTLLTTHRASLTTYIGSTNAALVALLNIKDTITSSKQQIEENTEALRDLKDGADPLDVASQNLTIKQRQNAVMDARELLADYSIRAPFDGTIASLAIQRGDPVSTGAAAAVLITTKNVAEISLNEIDAAKVKVGQKVMLTFDAIEDLEISGEVAEVDSVAAVSQGVVTYAIKIGFDTQDARVKPGMTVNADIITETIANTLKVNAGAVKTNGEGSYVETIDGAQMGRGPISSETSPRRISIETGISNDTETQVISGLKDGDLIIIRTINGTAQTTGAPTLFQAAGPRGPATGGGGGGNRTFTAPAR